MSETKNSIPEYLLTDSNWQIVPEKVRRIKMSFLDKTVISSARAVKSVYLQAENASRDKFFQRINPLVKLISLIYMVVVISIVHNPAAQIFISCFIFLLYLISGLKIFQVYSRILFVSFIFGFLVILPASLNVITQGDIVFNLVTLHKPYKFWIYNIPQQIGFTVTGFHVVTLFFLRVLNSVSFAFLIVYTTSFPALVKSTRVMGVPDTFLMILTLAYKYIFILSRTIEETYLALKSKLAGNIKNRNIRNIIGGRIYFIFKKSMINYENTFYAMVSRGYSGKVKLQPNYQLNFTDIAALVTVAAAGISAILF